MMTGWNYRGYDSSDEDGYPFTTGLTRRSQNLNYSSNSVNYSEDNDSDDDGDDDDDSTSSECSTVSTISGKSFASVSTLGTITSFPLVPNGTAIRRCSSAGSSAGQQVAIQTTGRTLYTPARPSSGQYAFNQHDTTGKQQRKRRKKKSQPVNRNTSIIVNAVLLLVIIMCILTPFYYALVYTLPKVLPNKKSMPDSTRTNSFDRIATSNRQDTTLHKVDTIELIQRDLRSRERHRLLRKNDVGPRLRRTI
jgi:hypothetical protein